VGIGTDDAGNGAGSVVAAGTAGGLKGLITSFGASGLGCGAVGRGCAAGAGSISGDWSFRSSAAGSVPVAGFLTSAGGGGGGALFGVGLGVGGVRIGGGAGGVFDVEPDF
jgi:hypothetical protein